MKAQLLKRNAPVESNPLEFSDVELKKPLAGQVRLKVLACGLCLTDKHIIEGDIPLHQSPIIPGHQIVGKVEKVGPGVDHIKKGMVVGVPWLSSTCCQCSYCDTGLENLCDQAKFTGYDIDGGFAEYTVANAQYVIPLEDHDDPVKIAPLLCAGIVGYRSYKLCNVKPRQKLALFGFGGSASQVIQVAKYFDNEVLVYTRGLEHQKMAMDLGASVATVAEDAEKERYDAAIIFAPSGELVSKALKGLAKGKTLAINAIHTSDISLPYNAIYHEREIKSVANATRLDGEEYIKLAREAKIEPKTTTYPLEKANQALNDLKQSKINGSAVFMP